MNWPLTTYKGRGILLLNWTASTENEADYTNDQPKHRRRQRGGEAWMTAGVHLTQILAYGTALINCEQNGFSWTISLTRNMWSCWVLLQKDFRFFKNIHLLKIAFKLFEFHYNQVFGRS